MGTLDGVAESEKIAMSEKPAKTYAFEAQWFNTADEMRDAFGDEFAELREQYIDLGTKQTEVWKRMTAIAADKMVATFAKEGASIPAGFEPKLVKSYRTGGIGLTLGEVTEKKATKSKTAKLAAKDKVASFAKLYRKDDGGKLVEKASELPDLPDHLRRASNKPNGKARQTA